MKPMTDSPAPADADARITPRLIDSFYTEAMLLADEARSYFDMSGREQRDLLDPFLRVGFACESLRVTTRIMHIVAWLLTQRAINSGEIEGGAATRSSARLGHASESDATIVARLPDAARRIIAASSELYSRIGRLDQSQDMADPLPSPARALMGRLERDFVGR
jgi:regulator of CtrA degradation